MKGYELYSWQSGNNWNFTLITGTNRNKTIEEITSGDNTEADWVKLSVTGTEALRVILSRLPEAESVFWGTISGTVTGYPPEDIINTVADNAKQLNLQFYVPQVR